jgi:PTS system ascorbate-specific IIB component
MVRYKFTLNRPLKILTICGVGMGSSLILKMTAEDAVKSIGIPAKVVHGVLTEAKGIGADVILAQTLHVEELKGAAPIVIGIKRFVDKEEIRQKLIEELKTKGWLVEEE